MRKFTTILLSVILLCLFTGCTSVAKVGMSNPMVQVDSPVAFSELNINIDAPENATDITYFIVDSIAQIDFIIDGKCYTLRAAFTKDDISGVTQTLDKEVYDIIEDKPYPLSAALKTIDGGKAGALATWFYEDCQLSLWTSNSVEVEPMSELVVEINNIINSYGN